MPKPDSKALATEGYIYGFPLVFNLDQVGRYVVTGIGSNPAAPFNQFSHARTLAGPADTFVTINNDTVYSMAQIDLSVGPVRLNVPDTNGRYYVLQFVDAWTDNFAYVGHRATGTKAGQFLLVPPGWTGQAEPGVTVIEFPTRVGSIVGRWACTGDDDLAAVHALQDATELRAIDASVEPEGIPVPEAGVPDDVAFWEKLRLWSQAFPPARRDEALQESLAVFGIGDVGDSPYLIASNHLKETLVGAAVAGEAALRRLLEGGGSSQIVNGWHLTFHVFDYNLDYFEVGALDDDSFKLLDPKVRLAERAAAAMGGLWGNHAYEAAYVMTYTDDHGEQLDGHRSYTLRLAPTPPVGAFWSLTMYDIPNFYLVDNEIDRYSIGDRTQGVVYEPDGSLVVTMSHDRPDGPPAAANWLPAPDGPFRPVLRMYEPDAAVLDGTYVLPAIVRG